MRWAKTVLGAHMSATAYFPAVRWTDRFKLRLSAVIWFILGFGFLLSAPVLFDVSPLVVLGVALVALLLALPGAWLIRRIFTGQRAEARLVSYLKAFASLLFALSIVLAAPIYYLALRTQLQPMVVPQATLSNGTKTVVFQGMVHVGSEGFYKSVVYDLEKALSDGYVLYYEGVQNDPAGDAWFSKTFASGGDLNTSYEQFGEACGLNFQLDYFGLLAEDMKARPDRHVKADVSSADMMHEYDRLMASDPAFAAAINAKAPAQADDSGRSNRISTLFDWLQSATPGQRNLIGTACRGWMNMMLAQPEQADPINAVVLDFRNRKLSERIVADTHQDIYITYGAGHLPGLLADLKAADPAWEIKSLKWLRAIDTPENLDGEI